MCLNFLSEEELHWITDRWGWVLCEIFFFFPAEHVYSHWIPRLVTSSYTLRDCGTWRKVSEYQPANAESGQHVWQPWEVNTSETLIPHPFNEPKKTSGHSFNIVPVQEKLGVIKIGHKLTAVWEFFLTICKPHRILTWYTKRRSKFRSKHQEQGFHQESARHAIHRLRSWKGLKLQLEG